MFRNETKNALMAVAVVAMFVLSAFGVAIVQDESDAAAYNESYSVKLKTGDTFNYTPTVNLTGATIAASTLTGASFEAGKLTYTSSTAGTTDRSVTLTASWNKDGLSQTATQTINFEVYDRIAISKTAASVGIPTTKTSGELDSVTITTTGKTYPATPSWGTATWTGTNAASYFDVTVSGSNLSVSVKSAPAAGSYSVSVPASYTAGAISGTGATAGTISDTIDYTLNITVDTELAVVEKTIYAYQGENNNSKDFEITTANGNGNAVTFTVDSASEAFATISTDTTNNKNAKLTINTGYSSFGISGDSKDFSITVNAAQAAYNSGGVEKAAQSDSGTITLKMYANLVFTSIPVQSAANTYASNVNPFEVLMTTTVTGANKVVFNWGDGSEDTVAVSGENNTVYHAHKYTKAGVYAITSTAYNDFNNSTTVVMYSVGEDSMTLASEHSLDIKDMKAVADTEAKTLTLSPVVVATVGATMSYEWTYTMGEDKDVKITAENLAELAFVKNTEVPGASLILDTTKLDDGARFSVKATATFADGETADDSIGYKYSTAEQPGFFDEHGWMFLVFAIVGLMILILSYFGVMPLIPAPWNYVLGFALIIIAIPLFMYGDFSGIIDELTGKN